MSIADKLITIAENVPKVFEAGQKSEYDRFWDEFQRNGTRDYYPYAFAGVGWNGQNFQPKYPVKIAESINGCVGIMVYFNRPTSKFPSPTIDLTDFCKTSDFSKAKSGSGMFKNANVDNITVDLSNCENLTETFSMDDYGSPTIKTVRLKVSEKCKEYKNAFGYLSSLINLTFMDGSVISASGMNLRWSTKLSKASIKSVINALSTTTSAYTVTFSKTAVNNAFETATGAADGTTSQEWADLIATKSNWTISLV